MSHLIELPDDVYNALEEAAHACGTSPANWLREQLQQPAGILASAPCPPPEIDWTEQNGDDVFWQECRPTKPR